MLKQDPILSKLQHLTSETRNICVAQKIKKQTSKYLVFSIFIKAAIAAMIMIILIKQNFFDKRFNSEDF